MEYKTKDSGERKEFDSGMRRDTDAGKPRYDLIPPELLKRLAELYARGAEKYGDCNWQLADSEEEFKRFKASGFRHFMQWQMGEEDEDHGVAAIWNIIAYEWLTKYKEPDKDTWTPEKYEMLKKLQGEYSCVLGGDTEIYDESTDDPAGVFE